MLINDAATTKIRTIVEEGMILKIGYGDSILCWQDRWCEAGPLSRAFPRLFALCLQKSCFLNQMGDSLDDSWSWNFRWRRALFDWEREEIGRLEHCIALKIPRRHKVDCVTWRESDFCYFPTKCIVDKVYESSSPILPKPIIDLVWKSCIPPKPESPFG